MKKAIGLAITVGLVVATYEAVQYKMSVAGSTYVGSAKAGVMSGTTIAATIAAALAGFLL